jgi:flagellar hook protein FlgE
MSITRSLEIGVSGLRANSDALGIASDNIANTNTVGFKGSRGVFEDVLGRSVASAEPVKSAGAGSRVAHVEQMWSQGALVTTDSPTDLAISGQGFFIVKGNLQGTDTQYYSRAGQFHVDNNGILVNSDDLRLQGYSAAPDGTMGVALGDLEVTGSTIPANPTTQVQLSANLDSEETVKAATFDPLNAADTSNFSQNVTVYDSLGASHEVTMFFHKSAPNTWDWHAVTSSTDLAGGTTPATPTEVASGALTFTTDGALDTETTNTSSWNFVDATPNQTITFDFGTSITTDTGTGLDGTTQFASKSTPVGLTQDGYSAGEVASISISEDGTITGAYSNGQHRVIGQVATADFANVDGLDRTGNNCWLETQTSGQPLIGGADTGGRGGIVSGALEQSNVDLGTEFVNLIAYQRGFQANARVITTADDIYGELVNIKR